MLCTINIFRGITKLNLLRILAFKNISSNPSCRPLALKYLSTKSNYTNLCKNKLNDVNTEAQNSTFQSACKLLNESVAQKLVKNSPHKIQPYLQLMRVDRPIGSWLLFWPCGWSIALAAPSGSLPDPYLLTLFALGSFIMRGAGCTINDMWDKDLDKKVTRTSNRPLAVGTVNQLESLIFLGFQLGLGCLILLQLNWYSILLGISSLEWMRDIGTIQNDPLCNLNDIYEDKPLELESDLKVAGVKAGSNHIHATMIKRFNQHSLNILKAQTASEKEKLCDEMLAKNPDAIANGDAEPELNLTKNKKIRLDEKLHYEDLEKVSKENKPSLVIHQRKRYLAGPSPDLILDEIRPEELPAMHHRLSCIVRSWEPDLHASQSPSSAFGVLQSLSEASRRGRNNPTSTSGNVLPRDLHSELGKVYSSAGELFRHFWSCFPPRTPQLKEKLHRMHTTLCKYHETTVREFQEMAIREYNRKNNILEHLQEMFQIANSKYENWKSRNVRRNGFIRGKV